MKYYTFAIILCLLFSNCQPSSDYKTTGLNNILKEFKTSIPDLDHVYILIPTFSCIGCVQQILIKLNEIIDIKDKPNITIIYQKINIDLSAFNKKAILYADINNCMDQLAFNIANLTIIKTKNKRIIEIITTNPENLELLINEDLLNGIRK